LNEQCDNLVSASRQTVRWLIDPNGLPGSSRSD
jgi:hypothetical protein